MYIEITKEMETLDGDRYMLYCTQDHPSREFREQSSLLMYAVMGDSLKFIRYIKKLIEYPSKNLVPFYPAKDNAKKVDGMEIIGTIIDGRLYFG